MMRPPFRPPLTHTADRPLDEISAPTAPVAAPAPANAPAPTGCGKPGCCRTKSVNDAPEKTPAALGPRTKPV